MLQDAVTEKERYLSFPNVSNELQDKTPSQILIFK